MGTARKTPCSTGINFYSFITRANNGLSKKKREKYSFLRSGKKKNVGASIIIIIQVLFGKLISEIVRKS